MKYQKRIEHQYYPMGNIRRQEQREERPKRQKRRKRYERKLGEFCERYRYPGSGGLPEGQTANPIVS